MREFVRSGDAYVAGLVEGERLALVDLIAATISTIHNGDPQTSAVAARLLPPASDDVVVDQQYRQMVEADLRSTKANRLVRLSGYVTAGQQSEGETTEVAADVETDVVIPLDEAADAAASLTDVRLLLAYLLDIPPLRDEADDDVDAGRYVATDSESQSHRLTSVEELLTVLTVIVSYLQDSLVEAMMATLDEEQR